MKLLSLVAFACVSAIACAAPIMDGTADAVYGTPLFVQDTQTGFGDSNLGVTNYANGSEIDAIYTYVEGGVLYLLIAGNLESNFNKLELFFDTKSGGQQILLNTNPDVDFNGLNRMAGLIFDNGFEPDYWVGITGGGDPYTMYSNYAELLTDGGGQGYYMGYSSAVSDGTLQGANNPYGYRVTIDNSNIGGVDGGNGPASGAGVTTGVEIAVPLASLGFPWGDIRACIFVNGQGHDFMSNQMAASLGNYNNPGDPAFVDLSVYPNDQFLTIPVNIQGDTDSNGCIDDADLTSVILDYGGPPSGSNGDTDVDDSGIVDDSDITIVILNFNYGCV